MNLILITERDFASTSQVVLSDHRAKHIHQVHQAEPGRRLKVGLVNGLMGLGEVTDAIKSGDDYQVSLTVELSQQPPEKLPLTVILALPRPKMLRRTIQNLTSLGVAHLVLINSYRVEKSYWQSPFLHQLDEYVQLGLEQSVDTVPMTIQLEKRFKPFVEDRLPELIQDKRAIVAHPYVSETCPRDIQTPLVLAIGPEGGFIQYEVDKLIDAGFDAVTLGQRIQKVETVLPQLIGRLY
ncbi:16S rRNA (uracil(1498)-N(3))-methyltransferase [Litoribrevibacter albus]|uniref:Ribosomal RNA small subunit methyltransferase E n=1 Tax=Litoribrevibacter albus TaxID=1473156 RepID=A0AA37SA59_9GAMM|nr:16S rRNA (uracil(1498)-N(3))-methyltransferase [Litoribrevibacter albus]GLQ32107.1 ribosomal RNA small subunit methyltransferase E [Litoribrevibacter albus]